VRKYKLNKKCVVCNNELSDKNKTGYCIKHVIRTGKNNPFYGKHHSKETIDKIKNACSISSKEHWKNDEYAKKVIKNNSKPRKESFKKEQSKRMIEWYKNNPEQKTLRSNIMKNNWKNGVIIPNNYSYNISNMEKDFLINFQNLYLI
jgi:hypothetical protein